MLFVNPQRKLLQAEEETDEEKQFRAIYQKIAGEVSTFPLCVPKWEAHTTHNVFFFALPASGHAGLRQRAPNNHEERTQQTWAEITCFILNTCCDGQVLFFILNCCCCSLVFCRRWTEDGRVQPRDLSEYDRLDGCILAADVNFQFSNGSIRAKCRINEKYWLSGQLKIKRIILIMIITTNRVEQLFL